MPTPLVRNSSSGVLLPDGHWRVARFPVLPASMVAIVILTAKGLATMGAFAAPAAECTIEVGKMGKRKLGERYQALKG